MLGFWLNDEQSKKMVLEDLSCAGYGLASNYKLGAGVHQMDISKQIKAPQTKRKGNRMEGVYMHLRQTNTAFTQPGIIRCEEADSMKSLDADGASDEKLYAPIHEVP